MNRENEFDELARRKLEERSFAYQESDWKQAQQAIAAQRGRKRRGFWLSGAAALLMVGTAAWWTLREAERAGTLAITAPVTNRRTSIAEQHAMREAPSPAMGSASNTSASSAVPAANDNASAAIHPDERASTASRTGVASNTPAQAQASSTAAAQIPSASPNTPQHQRTSTAVASTAMTISGTPTAVTSAATPNTNVPSTVDKDTGTPATMSGTAMPSLASASTERGSAEPPPPVMAVDPAAEALPSTTQNAYTLDGTELITLLTTAPTTTPSDSATTAPTAVPAVPPIIPDRAPWEISVLGGAFSSIATYSGGNSAEWSGDISREVSPGFGAELMHLGRNIGLGVGLHYGTYAERIQVQAIDQTSIERWNYWYLMPVDTTILIITDTVEQGGQIVYEGESITTTVNVLTLGEDSTVTTTRVRYARELVNRTSYLEVPLLVDAHLVQGRWSMGLRGGPTVGLLTGRTGSIPNSTNDGYTELGDQAFREVVFGWTARAYLRYRWNAAWSIGIEPAMRGLFSNSLSEGDVQRRSSAFGGMISLSYRLR
jgi:hypothetical protein